MNELPLLMFIYIVNVVSVQSSGNKVVVSINQRTYEKMTSIKTVDFSPVLLTCLSVAYIALDTAHT